MPCHSGVLQVFFSHSDGVTEVGLQPKPAQGILKEGKNSKCKRNTVIRRRRIISCGLPGDFCYRVLSGFHSISIKKLC